MTLPRVRALPVILLVLLMALSNHSHCFGEVLLVGDKANAFSECLDSLGVACRVLESAADISETDLSGFAAVLVCASDHKRPQALARGALRRLESYADTGGRVLLEFAVPEDCGEMFGAKLAAEPVLARHERIVVSRAPAGLKALPRGTLLDEQYSYALPALSLPPGAARLLDYGQFVGTYKAKTIPSRFYEFWVDLGEKKTICGASQRYGCLNPYYFPDSV